LQQHSEKIAFVEKQELAMESGKTDRHDEKHLEKELIERKNSNSGFTLAISSADAALDRKVRLKCDYKLVPMLFFLLLCAFIDRINIGNARIQGLERDLNMKGHDFNIALFVFFIPYILLEVPSNLVMRKVRPSLWLSSLIFGWGEGLRTGVSWVFADRNLGRSHHGLSGRYQKLWWFGGLPCFDRCL
jgi:hypothetical protein